jgi:hypothetical protein
MVTKALRPFRTGDTIAADNTVHPDIDVIENRLSVDFDHLGTSKTLPVQSKPFSASMLVKPWPSLLINSSEFGAMKTPVSRRTMGAGSKEEVDILSPSKLSC